MPNSADKSAEIGQERAEEARLGALPVDDAEDFDSFDMPRFRLPGEAEEPAEEALSALPSLLDEEGEEVASATPPYDGISDSALLVEKIEGGPMLLDALSEVEDLDGPVDDTPPDSSEEIEAFVDAPHGEDGEGQGYDRQELVKTIQMQAVDRAAIERELAQNRMAHAEMLDDHAFAPGVLVKQPRTLVGEWSERIVTPARTEELPEVELLDASEEDLLEVEPEEIDPEELTELELEPVSDAEEEEPAAERATPAQAAPAVKPPPRPAQPTPAQPNPAVRQAGRPPQPTPIMGRPPVAQQPRSGARPKGKDSEMQGLVQELLDDYKSPEASGKKPRWLKNMPGRETWFKRVFNEEYLRTLPRGYERQANRDVDFVDDSLCLAEGARILDLACGFGRHTVLMAQRGYEMAGLDLSMPLLQLALTGAQRMGLSIKFIHGDMRSMQFNGIFDGCYLWQSSFGYFDDLTNFKVLQGITRALKPGGRFVLDILNRDYVVAEMPARTWWEGTDCIFLEEVDFDAATSVLHTKRSFIYEDGSPPLEQNSYIRLYSMHEILNLLQSAGLRPIEISGEIHHRGVFLGANSARLVILAEKPLPPE